MKFIYYLAAIGAPDIIKKLEILSNNLTYIYSNIKTNFDIILNCYSDFEMIHKFVSSHYFIDNVYVHNKKGVLTELWLTNPHNSLIENYDYLLFILDDVQIVNLDINKMIEIKNKFDIAILSPKVLKASHQFMSKYCNNMLTLNNSVEIYCILFKPKEFNDYCLINTVENKWMWGVDLLFGHFGISAGIFYGYEVEHMFPSKSNGIEASALCVKYLISKGFTSVSQVRFKYPEIKRELGLIQL